jgi:hypothetical protein
MRFAKIAMAVAAVTMATAPVVAAPVNQAASLSVSNVAPVRASSHAGKSKLAGPFLIALIAIVAVGAGIGVAASSGDSASS